MNDKEVARLCLILLVMGLIFGYVAGIIVESNIGSVRKKLNFLEYKTGMVVVKSTNTYVLRSRE